VSDYTQGKVRYLLQISVCSWELAIKEKI